MQIIYIDMHKIADPKPSTVVGKPIMLRGFSANCPSKVAKPEGRQITRILMMDSMNLLKDEEKLNRWQLWWVSIAVGQYDS